MSEYVKIKRKLYDELVETKAKYVTLCQMLEVMKNVYEQNKQPDEKHDRKLVFPEPKIGPYV